MASDKIAECSKLIARNKLKVALAESATAGRLASEFSLAEESGDILLGGIVCYDACTKEDLFGISPETIQQYTAESAEVTKALAEGLRKYFDCDIAVAITGLTTPGGSETPEKPVGTMFIHIVLPNNRYCAHREVFEGNAEKVIKQTIDRVGTLLTDLLSAEER
ncbi:damage-inducible protein CinA [Flavobacterium cyanobacteriorum]|uniref:Damage-inducible protein CinA n=1 Tax=Flavobacterium cyanobacteriorum TaxID=2022802 RepID=A0A255Z6S3_9FLAO|nr:CinA family protein [Flavobacterium cyanobacteriorum]OYQ36330.1 damage-inducible protein CinA [Flavobacterium cyanobacteriorum]